MIIRKAKSSDIGQIIDFQLKMALETENIVLNHSTVKKGVNAVILDSSKGMYYVAEKDGKIIGSLLTTYEWSDWRNATILWIQSVYILPEYRRKGVYRKLYTHIKDIVIEDSQLNGIRLYADKTNVIAHKTYSTLGMNPDHYIIFEWMK